MNAVPTLTTLLHQDANNTMDETQPAKFRTFRAESVYDQAPPLEFLIGEDKNGLITKGSVNLLVGEGGSKKTWAALDLAACVSIGKNWLDLPTKQTTVLIIDEESGERRLRRRLFESLNGHLIKREEAAPIVAASLCQFDARNLDDINALHVLIMQEGAGLVIIDALADVMIGSDENSVRDVQPVFLNLRRVAEATQAAIILIHHSNKQNGYRGSTAIKGAVDLMLMIESPIGSKYITFNAEKARDIEPRTFTALATWTEGQFYLTATDVNPKAQTNKSQRHVLRYLLEHANATIDSMAGAAAFTAPTIKQAVYALIDSKDIERTNPELGTGRGIKATFDLTLKGKQLAEAE